MKCDPFILWKTISFKADDMRSSEKSKRQQKMIAQNKYYKIITDIIASPADILKRASRTPKNVCGVQGYWYKWLFHVT